MRDLFTDFEQSRAHLRAVAARLLGPAGELDDALQETWVRAAQGASDAIQNVRGWLTTILSRVCLDMLRARRRTVLGTSREAPAPTPSRDALEHAEQIGLALCILLERLTPNERVAYVLHDLFALPFEDIARIIARSPVATKKLASRARARLREATAEAAAQPNRDLVRAFLAAAQVGDLDALLKLLAPEVVRIDGVDTLHGAARVAEETRRNTARARYAVAVSVDGAPGLLVAPGGKPELALRLTCDTRRITRVEVVRTLDVLHLQLWK